MAKDIKVIPSKECVPQHKLLICELRLKKLKPHPKPFSPKLRYWKLKEPTVQEEYERVFKSKVNAFNNVETSTEEILNQLKTALLDTTNETCGKTKKRHHKRETWWWNDEVNSAIAEKRRFGKRGSRVVAKNNTYRPNEMRNKHFTLQRRPLKRRSFQT